MEGKGKSKEEEEKNAGPSAKEKYRYGLPGKTENGKALSPSHSSSRLSPYFELDSGYALLNSKSPGKRHEKECLLLLSLDYKCLTSWFCHEYIWRPDAWQAFMKLSSDCSEIAGDDCILDDVVAVNDGVGQAGDGGTRNATYGASKGRAECKRP